MDIGEIVHNSRLVHLESTGIEPNTMYLGDAEFDALRIWAQEREYCYGPFIKTRGKHRQEFYGMRVYHVDADSHFHIAYRVEE